jgi:hypothetical protein
LIDSIDILTDYAIIRGHDWLSCVNDEIMMA